MINRITSIKFSRYKALKDYSVALDKFNILVGTNNSGKSTVLSAFRILSEALKKARSRLPTRVYGPNGMTQGYEVNLANIPIAIENIFFNYETEEPASIKFRLSNGNSLLLFFPDEGKCNLICLTNGKPIKSKKDFANGFNLEIGFVPILGPVEHNEPLYQIDAASNALYTHTASRNFRNIWYHFPEQFNVFKDLITKTWPGMNINRPEVRMKESKPYIDMFCTEERFDREIFWAGFGFQVWCQMLTYAVMHKDASIFIIDEPDIYLHSDLQRQLINILRDLGPDILIATHSVEMVSQAESDELLIVTKKSKSAKKVKDPSKLESIFRILGSNLNPVLTQLAKTKKIVFVEGKDFQIFSRFANKLGYSTVAMRGEFAVVPTEGFNPQKAKTFAEGVQSTISSSILIAVIFDRDYRSDSEVSDECAELDKFCSISHIHTRKELENFLLVPNALLKAINNRIEEKSIRNETSPIYIDNIDSLINQITSEMKSRVQAQIISRQLPSEKAKDKSVDDTTIMSKLILSFENNWANQEFKLNVVSGKEFLAKVNTSLQDSYGITITTTSIIDAMSLSDVPIEMKELIESLDEFSKKEVTI